MRHKNLSIPTALTLALLVTLACKSKPKDEANSAPRTTSTTIAATSAPVTNGTFTAVIDGKLYTGRLNHATQTKNYANSGNNVFTIESFASSDVTAAATTQHFVFLIPFTGEMPAPGMHDFEKGELSRPFSYYKGSYSDGSINHYEFDPAKGGGGSIAITDIDEANGVVSGTFSGTAVSRRGKVQITDGKFTNLTIVSGN